jgi:hypothetical protein
MHVDLRSSLKRLFKLMFNNKFQHLWAHPGRILKIN